MSEDDFMKRVRLMAQHAQLMSDRADAMAAAAAAWGSRSAQQTAAERLMASQGQASLGLQQQGLNELRSAQNWTYSRMVSAEAFEALQGRVTKLEELLDKVCVEHEDCCASLLAHACKKTTHTSGDDTNVLKTQEK